MFSGFHVEVWSKKLGFVIDKVDQLQSTAYNRLMYATVINENWH